MLLNYLKNWLIYNFINNINFGIIFKINNLKNFYFNYIKLF